jgi:hypothetical protein
MCVLSFYTSLSEIFLIPRMIERDMIINICWAPCKVYVILSDLNEILIFWGDLKNYTNTKFHENPSSGSRVRCGQMEGQTDVTKLQVAFFATLRTCLRTVITPAQQLYLAGSMTKERNGKAGGATGKKPKGFSKEP